MRYMHIRPGDSEGGYQDRKGAITLAYEFSDDAVGRDAVALVGLAMCSPAEQFWRKKGNHIARTRLRTNPIILSQEEPFTEEGLYSVMKAFFLDPPEWEVAESLPFQPKFEVKVSADIIGPGGSLVHIDLDVRGKKVPSKNEIAALAGEEEIVLRSWALRLPSWVQEWAKELG